MNHDYGKFEIHLESKKGLKDLLKYLKKKGYEINEKNEDRLVKRLKVVMRNHRYKNYQELLSKLGKHRTSVSCLYFSKLENIDLNVLKRIIRKSVADMKSKYTWK